MKPVIDAIEYSCVALVVAYAVQHFVLTIARLSDRGRKPSPESSTEFSAEPSAEPAEDDPSFRPSICVLIPAHNEAAVIGGTLEAVLLADYPRDRFRVLVVSDHSTDGTGEIVRGYCSRRVELVERNRGERGKPQALNDVLPTIADELIVQLDADNRPRPDFLQRIAWPFRSADVGLVMGRVVPSNSEVSIVTRLLHLERVAGYQVAQQGRMQLGLLPMYGGTAGAIRRRMLAELGGWRNDAFAEDTDLTFRAILQGHRTVYVNEAVCYEQVPENWIDRERQVTRWARGHNDCLVQYALPILFTRRLHFLAKIDCLLLLSVYLSPLLLLLSVVAATLGIALYGNFTSELTPPLLGAVLFGAIGNFALFFEVAAGLLLDDRRRLIRTLPLMPLSFFVSCGACVKALLQTARDAIVRRRTLWVKTPRADDRPRQARSARPSARPIVWVATASFIASATATGIGIGWSATIVSAIAAAVFALPFLPALSVGRKLHPADDTP